MELFTIILCVIPTIVTSITVSSNGNSPEIKMLHGMMVDVQKGFEPMTMKAPITTTNSNYEKIKKLGVDSTKLSINERYRRLIPYMTFYYANDLISTTEPYLTNNVEVEKAQILETQMVQSSREPKKIVYSSNRNIPRYQGNRITHFNIASANPVKVYYKDVPYYQSQKVTPNINPLIEHNQGRYVQKPIKSHSAPFTPITRRPFNIYKDEPVNVHYYVPEEDQNTKYKLVPYEQTPPVKVLPQNENIFEPKNPIAVPVLVQKEPIYIKPRPIRPQFVYENIPLGRKQPAVVSESYYEKRLPILGQPVIENGFKPIIGPLITTEAPVFTTILPPPPPRTLSYEPEKRPAVQILEQVPIEPEADFRPNYFQYFVDPPVYRPEYAPPLPQSKPVTLSTLLNSLQLNKSIPKPITKENVGSSIRTLLQVLNTMKVMSQQNNVEVPVRSTVKPLEAHEVDMTPKSAIEMTPAPSVSPAPVAVDLHDEPYLAPVNTPSQHLDEVTPTGGSRQHFPRPSGESGGTPGRPDRDYPILASIPHSSFDCKTQRYKGFFADPETRCQVWHYCDLNGGQASFLCPNGTIFSQAALTCDWWFNVKCALTTQLYVLNESLYKYILPHSPKFPEDYSGPLVDKYLTLKFKEMEEQFKKNKHKSASEKEDSDETDDSSESSTESESGLESASETPQEENSQNVSEASVIVETSGMSGNVERLHEK